VFRNEVDQFWFKDLGDLGRPARKGIQKNAVSRVEQNRGNCFYSELGSDKAVGIFRMGEGRPDDWEFQGSTSIVSESPRQGLELGCQCFAGLAPWSKHLYDDQLVGIIF